MPKYKFLLGAVLAALFVTAPLSADSSSTAERTVTKISENIYTIRHPDAPDGFPQGNTTVIIGDDAVLVVDSCYLPSAAREDIAQIRQWTSKPVRYLVNTHWHYDHQIGNGEYAAAFPGLQIVAHTETRKLIRDYNPGWFAKYGELTARIKKTLDTGIRSNGQALTAEQRPGLEQSLAGRGPVAEEFKTHPGRVPDVTFDHELTVDLGHREVRLLHPGRGDTAGDVVVFVPKERVLATGDLLTSPIPYVGGGFTSEEAETLQKLILLDAAITIPGHGEVLRGEAGPARMKLFRDFLVEAWAGVNEAVKRLGSNPADFEKINAEVEKIVDFNAWRQKFAGDSKADQDFFDGFPRKGVVQAAYAEIWPR